MNAQNPESTATDQLGRPIQVGDTVVYLGTNMYNEAALETARVTAIKSTQYQPLVTLDDSDTIWHEARELIVAAGASPITDAPTAPGDVQP